jgi:adenine/guanine phosphoribosyltransferase-like PRPP-binding protein
MIHNAFPSINTIITVANGANALAEPVTFAMKRLRQPVTPIVTAKDSKIIYFEPDEYHKLFGTDAVIIDDVLTRATNVTFVGGLAENAGARVHGAGVVWRRDMSSELVLPRHPDPLPIHALIEEEIPAWNKSRQTT